MDFDKMLAFVRKTLEENDAIKSRNVHHQFRDRAKHSFRIFKWVERLAPDFSDADLDVAKTAAIFHDVGYAKGKMAEIHPTLLDEMTAEALNISIFRDEKEKQAEPVVDTHKVLEYFDNRVFEFRRKKVADYLSPSQ